jgi:DnaJ-class molecular chaperone
MDKSFNPERYGMLPCNECDGSGKLLNEFEDVEVCPRCGGFGFIKKEEDSDKMG